MRSTPFHRSLLVSAKVSAGSSITETGTNKDTEAQRVVFSSEFTNFDEIVEILLAAVHRNDIYTDEAFSTCIDDFARCLSADNLHSPTGPESACEHGEVCQDLRVGTVLCQGELKGRI